MIVRGQHPHRRTVYGLCEHVIRSLWATLLAACGGVTRRRQAGRSNGRKPGRHHEDVDQAVQHNLSAGAKPNLTERLGFIQPAANETQDARLAGIKSACEECDIEVISANADGKPVATVRETRAMLTRGLAGVVTQPLDLSQSPGKLEASKKDDPSMFLGGVDGTSAALAKTKEPTLLNSPASIAQWEGNLYRKAAS